MVKLEKSQKFQFPEKLYKIRKNVVIQNFLLQTDLQI